MKPPKFEVRLTAEQRDRLQEITRNGSAPAKKIAHARVLLMADADHPEGRWRDTQIVAATGLHLSTVARIRIRFVTQGETPALERKARSQPPVPPKIDGRVEAHLIALCCGPPPAGRVRWTLTLLAGELTRRGLVTSISIEAVRGALKKTNYSPGGSSAGASRSGTPPASSPGWSRSLTSMPPPTPRTNR